ncbi:N-acetylglucosaminyl transferase [Nitrospira sp. KM1]|uniref:undecaprenyldiphospho-muramoylpentapeptide beta-N-acetylglucosaminyltransferase n=1 Tax=Nitrospira sp. KM1 TaxID=1936990 RepID=UPI0013A7850B|nr:undecaprenyldiphospho-muramoylpentapeptide beta-N-acetylglucosaminyltransferase [Nitrospira sp. KM1]BCA55830.1 N-acetylglucosaminyl transferase [Nitrospira sp. KM1]
MTIIIAAGGTGGHLYPAVALAREFLRRDPTIRIQFVGTARGIETKVLAHEGFELRLISAKPVMGTGVLGIAKGLAAMPVSLWQCVRMVLKEKADLIVGVGGYTSPMMVVAAAMAGVPRVILEPNANPGMANKAIGWAANRVFLAFESAATSFNRARIRVVGTPVRREFLDHVKEAQLTPRTAGRRHVLIFGGSQGAKAINTAVLEGLSKLAMDNPSLTITHQTGQPDHARVQQAYRGVGIAAEVVPFLYDMPAAIGAADLVVSRSGAMTIAELTTCGKPAVLIPLPTAIYGHQMNNAQVMEAAGGAVVLPQSELTGDKLAATVTSLLKDENRLREMGTASLALRRTDAAEMIVRECYSLMGDRHDDHQSHGATGV